MLEKFCNTTQIEPMTTPTNDISLVFHSDATGTDTGFQIHYSVVEGKLNTICTSGYSMHMSLKVFRDVVAHSPRATVNSVRQWRMVPIPKILCVIMSYDCQKTVAFRLRSEHSSWKMHQLACSTMSRYLKLSNFKFVKYILQWHKYLFLDLRRFIDWGPESWSLVR